VCIGRRSASSPRAHRGSRSARSRRPSCSSRFRHVSGMIKVDKDNSVHCCHGPADTPQSLAFAPALDRLAQSRSVVAHADLDFLIIEAMVGVRGIAPAWKAYRA
jgi:hypothetical protein